MTEGKQPGRPGVIARTVGWVMSLRPVRVFTHYTDINGNLLASGMSYQAVFAVFAAIFVAFSIAGFWLIANPEIENALLDIINRTIPGLIGDDGIIKPEQLDGLSTALGWTGVIALVGLLWTALGWLSFLRLAIRAIFGMPKDTTNFVLAKAVDLGLGVAFGLVLAISAVLSVVTTQLLNWLLGLIGIDDSVGGLVAGRFTGLLIVFVINTLVLAVMFRVLSRVAIPLRRLLVGALLGGLALGAIQVLGGLLLGGASRNPLLASFAVFIGLLIWFNLVSTITLLAASWIAVGMQDAGISPLELSDEERAATRAAQEHEARLVVARAELRDAQAAYDRARGFRRLRTGRRLERARAALEELDPETSQQDDASGRPGASGTGGDSRVSEASR
ncbi:YihY/virulence factor BrkB family protein [Compostimonas suwonensis]|uniref:Membrane protein n=1 Tax=Compostimonas suwonensis TaxID=1048394 RepID=A0A2M9BV23_9MICO|nr:YihY/virulence factor BrkB family protein [Compostimonas suwonensis]PJJ61793.1 membrane protein [Compostimonas suwonensis]